MFHLPQVLGRGSSRRTFAFCCSAIAFTVVASTAASAATLCVNPGGKAGCHSTISAAVSAASAGDTIQVARGSYKETVTITKSISLISTEHLGAVIDATGLSNGIFINGMAAAPAAGVSNVVVSGFWIKNANYEGILIANASAVTVLNNLIAHNDLGLDVSAQTCTGIPAFETNEQSDCGEGIHLMGVDHSLIFRNESARNSGGILITDETGASQHNLIKGNYVHDNPYACGITMASHGPATSVIPSAKASYGDWYNTVDRNISEANGLGLPGAGAGVGIFAPFPGTTSSGNVVIDNQLFGNGLPGVTMHNHAAAPSPAPPVNLNDNQILGNHIYDNAADTDDAHTDGPTGIDVYSVAPISGTVIAQNVIQSEAIAVNFNAPSGQLTVHLNDFDSTGIGIDNVGTGTIDATDNWWHCATGAVGSGCATAAGKGVSWSPWLSSAFSDDSSAY